MENSTTDPLWAECRKKKQTNKVKIKLHDFICVNILIIPQIKTWSDRKFQLLQNTLLLLFSMSHVASKQTSNQNK